MATQPKPYITEEQYIELEERAERRSEYFRGEMFPVEFATIPHAVIHSNLVLKIGTQLSGSGCQVFFNELRVRVSPTGLYTYPDIVVVCGEPEISEKDKNAIVNPKVIIEILSPTTQSYDRGDKFAHYRSIPSFQEYLLIAQDRIHAEHHIKQGGGGWLLIETSDGDTTIAIETIGVRFQLSDAYTKVKF